MCPIQIYDESWDTDVEDISCPESFEKFISNLLLSGIQNRKLK